MSRQRKDTRIHLVQEIEALVKSGAVALTPGIQTILDEARAGEYHDYKNKKYVCGKVAVVDHLQSEGLVDLANRVIDGEFDEEADEEADEEDKAMMRSQLPESMWDAFELRAEQ